jgi:phospholipid-binding lipoprotein MlaA
MTTLGKIRAQALTGVAALWVGAFAAASVDAATELNTKYTNKTSGKHDEAQSPEENDPLESVNRGIFWFNRMFDQVLLKPITQGYRFVVPEKGREMVDNFVSNLYTPVVLVNSVMQRDPQNSFATGWRFILNTTFGVGGLFDFASAVGLHNRPADLGETMAFYGVGPGPYVYLPFIGPSDLRDSFGRLGDAFMMPTNYAPSWFKGGDGYWIEYGTWGLTAIDERSKNWSLINDLYSNSLDPYTTFRSAYTQKRASDIRRAKTERDKALEHGSCTK